MAIFWNTLQVHHKTRHNIHHTVYHNLMADLLLCPVPSQLTMILITGLPLNVGQSQQRQLLSGLSLSIANDPTIILPHLQRIWHVYHGSCMVGNRFHVHGSWKCLPHNATLPTVSKLIILQDGLCGIFRPLSEVYSDTQEKHVTWSSCASILLTWSNKGRL